MAEQGSGSAARALIAGGGGAIGRVVAASFVADGYDVTLLDAAIDLDSIATDVGARSVRCDVTDYESVVAATCDIDTLDVLVNAVGAWPVSTIDELTAEVWDQVIRVNLTGVFHAIKAVLQPLRAARGSVVNLSSTSALRGAPTMIAYSSAKAGIIGLTRSMAAALGPDGVRVNAVLPGVLVSESNSAVDPARFERARTERALRRDGVPDDVVGAIRFFADRSSAFVTGQTMVVDGGQVFG
jgi:NAD(P)-dependent dehydrogenase (short-subunit alcohol dehydrogenase family)